VNLIRPKPTRLRLDPDLYDQLRNQVLRRDGWRCRACGTMSNLEVHHTEFRSHSGTDSDENLITLCNNCHSCCASRLGPEFPTDARSSTVFSDGTTTLSNVPF